MYQKPEKGKLICLAYKNGTTISEIARALGHGPDLIRMYLENYFETIYGEPFKTFTEQREERLREIYKRYQDVYVQGLFTRAQICEIIECNVNELEAMLKKYDLHHQWLQTYDGQQTLCNVSKEFKDSINEFVEEFGYKSVRAVAVEAINEFMLQKRLRRDGNENVCR